MPTIERARVIKYGMGYNYTICWDEIYSCYRVIPRSDSRINYELLLVEE
jgi:hypothetical protein